MLQIRRYSTFSYAYCYYLFGRYLSMIGWKKIDDIFHKSTMMLNVIIEKVFYIICLNGPWYYNLVRIYFSNPHRLIKAKFWFLWGSPILWVIKKKKKSQQQQQQQQRDEVLLFLPSILAVLPKSHFCLSCWNWWWDDMLLTWQLPFCISKILFLGWDLGVSLLSV